MQPAKKVRGLYRKPLEQKGGHIPLEGALLKKMAQIFIDSVVEEAKKDFAKRGWSLGDPMEGPPLDKSFTFEVNGGVFEIRSTFYGMQEMLAGDIPGRKMTWLTQEEKEHFPSKFPLTEGEKERGMKRGGRVSKGERLPLVVPLRGKDGTVILRMAPFNTSEAWIHPGIAKYTFMERAIRKAKTKWAGLMIDELAKVLAP